MITLLSAERLKHLVNVEEERLFENFWEASSFDRMKYFLAAAAGMGNDPIEYSEAAIRVSESKESYRKFSDNLNLLEGKIKSMNFHLLQGSTSGYRIYETNNYPAPWKVIFCTIMWHWEEKTGNFVHTLAIQLKSEIENSYAIQVGNFPPRYTKNSHQTTSPSAWANGQLASVVRTPMLYYGKERIDKHILYEGNLPDLLLKAAKQMYANQRKDKIEVISNKFNF